MGPRLAILLVLVACRDAPIDTADTADTEPSGDGGPDPYTFEGTSSLQLLLDGAVVCDAQATLIGTPYTGSCDDCTWVTTMTATLTADASTPECDYESPLTFMEGAGYHDLFLAAMDTYGAYTDVLLSGWARTDTYAGVLYDHPGPYYTVLGYEGALTSTWSSYGDSLAWEYAGAGTSTIEAPAYYEACGPVEAATAGDTTGGLTGEGAVDCAAAALVDVWELQATGAPLSAAVDTSGASTAADLWMWLNGPDTCTLFVADDEVACSSAPPRYQCPAVTVAAPEAGAWQLVVAATGHSCADDARADYVLAVAGADSLTLTHDDASRVLSEAHEYTLTVAISGTLTAE